MATTASGGDGLLDGRAVRLAPAALPEQAAAIGPVMAPARNAAELPRGSDSERELNADLVCDRPWVKPRVEQDWVKPMRARPFARSEAGSAGDALIRVPRHTEHIPHG